MPGRSVTSGYQYGDAVIVGIGQTEYSKSAGRSETQLAAEAILAALTDAGLSPGDVHGIVSYTVDPVEETELVRTLGIQEVNWSSRVPYGGGGSQGVMMHARAAINSGAADVVIAYRAVRAHSGHRYGRAEARGPGVSHAGTTAAQWCAPYGILTPASWMALNATRYMHSYGCTNADFGRVVVQLREYAATNPLAHFYGRPITLDEHQASRWIAEPSIRLFDCCQTTDGAAALVMTTSARGVDLDGKSVGIVAAGGMGLFEEEIATNHYAPNLAQMEASALLANSLFEKAGIERSDIDVAMIYDAFTPIFLMQLEGLGFCGFGEAGNFVADGHIAPGGALPCNTNGGLIGEGYIHGLNLTLEAVRQLRGTAANQIAGARTAIVSASRTATILQSI
jgi:acetyl-CoA acetyltransferase